MTANEFIAQLSQKLNRSLLSSLEACVRCGVCAESCHYFRAMPEPQYIPAQRAEAVRRLWRRQSLLPRLFPRWFGASLGDDDQELKKLQDVVFGTCTMCRRCVLNCPMGVDTGLIVRTARGILASAGYIPEGLKATVDIHLATGNNMGVSKEDLVETLEWMEEQLQGETGDPEAKIPLDKPGARYLYTLNPREPKYFPLTILAAAKIFYAAGADWTISTQAWDVTNYALFSGEDAAARQIVNMLAQEAKRLGVKEVIMAECGHGYRAFRWEGENWIGEAYPFKVRGFVELMAEFLEKGTIKVNPEANPQPVTYHDPCNQARNGGIVEEPRYILARVVKDFREMEPHGENNFCCGGGGGMLSMTEYSKNRIAAGETKARQIAATGAKIVATSCHNCLDQLAEINRHYKLGVKIHNLCELVAEALVLEPPKSS